MAPKKKTAMAIGSLGAEGPVPLRASSGPVMDRTRAAVREHQHHPGSQSLASDVVRTPDDRPHVARSKDGAGAPAGGAGPSRSVVVPPTGGAATSKMPMPATTARSSHGVRDEQRHHTSDPGRRRGKSPVHRSRDEGVQHARRSAGENGAQPLGRDGAPSNVVRSRSAPRSTQLSPPPTPAEALARAQLLLDFPPAAEKLDEWRATVRSLVGIANKDEPRPAGPVGRRSVEPPHASGERAEGDAATVHSPPPRQLPRVSGRRDDARDNISIASSDPRTHHDQRQVLWE